MATTGATLDSIPTAPNNIELAIPEYSAAVEDRVKAISPWRQYVTTVVPGPEILRYSEHGAKGAGYTQPSVTLGGPASQLTGFYIPSDFSNPTVPSDITWSAPNSITPAKYICVTTLSEEQTADWRQVLDNRDGVPVFAQSGAVDPVVSMALAEALIRDENATFAHGANTTSEPITGLVNLSGINSTAVAGSGTWPYLDDVVDAVASLQIAKWQPTVIWASPHWYQLARKAKDNSGRYLFSPSDPILSVAGLPVIELNGLPSGNTHVVIADATKILVVRRYCTDGHLIEVRHSSLGATFATFRRTFKIEQYWSMNVIPGYGPAITKLTGMTA